MCMYCATIHKCPLNLHTWFVRNRGTRHLQKPDGFCFPLSRGCTEPLNPPIPGCTSEDKELKEPVTHTHTHTHTHTNNNNNNNNNNNRSGTWVPVEVVDGLYDILHMDCRHKSVSVLGFGFYQKLPWRNMSSFLLVCKCAHTDRQTDRRTDTYIPARTYSHPLNPDHF